MTVVGPLDGSSQSNHAGTVRAMSGSDVREAAPAGAEVGGDMGEEVVIQARGLCRTFGEIQAVRGLDLDVNRGEIFGFLGPNGAGKSTTIRMLVGLMAPTSGSCRVLGLEMPKRAEELRSRVGYMTQRFSLYTDLTVEENLDFAGEIFGLETARRRRRIEKIMEEFDLTERRRQLPAKLSGGWRQRLALAVATLHEPELLVLDEPTAGVDPDSRRVFWEKLFQLADGGTTILVSTHYMDEAVRCHRLCVIRDGVRVALATPEQLVAAVEPRVLEFSGRPSLPIVRALQADSDVASVVQLGHRVHVLLQETAGDREVVVRDLASRLKKLGLDVEGVIADAHLEDALIVLSRGYSLPLSGSAESLEVESGGAS